MPTMKEQGFGAIIHGTASLRDVLPALRAELRRRDPAAYEQHNDVVDYDGDEAMEEYCELEDALNECAPEGAYFGAHPGDGSDLGFWPRYFLN